MSSTRVAGGAIETQEGNFSRQRECADRLGRASQENTCALMFLAVFLRKIRVRRYAGPNPSLKLWFSKAIPMPDSDLLLFNPV